MSYCPDCGVDIGNAPRCPLCGTENPKLKVSCEDSGEHTQNTQTPPSGGLIFEGAIVPATFSEDERRTIVWEILSVAFGIAILVLGAVNFFVSRRVSWALYPIISLLLLWTEATSLLVLRKKRVLSILLAMAAPPLFLLGLGFASGSTRWALGLAIPIAVLAESLTGATVLAIGLSKHKGLNILSYVLIACSLLCIGIEAFIDLFARGRIELGWSVITAIALVPIAAFLIYLHYRVAKTTNLRRLFHLFCA